MVSIMIAGIVATNGNTNEQVTATHINLMPTQENSVKSNWFFSTDSTNGLACVLWVETAWPLQNSQLLPACLVYVTNATTNRIWWLFMPATNLFNIELFDSQGKSVEKTSLGKMFDLPLTQKRISDWYNDKHWQIMRHGRAFEVYPSMRIQTRSFSIPEAFEIKEAGEYTLHVQMRLIGNGPDSSGHFPITWLPEAVAKVQIRPEDIPPENLLPNVQTNSSAK